MLNRSLLRPQGLLAPQILFTHDQLNSRKPSVLVEATIQFCNWCTAEAGLVKHEIQPDAWLIYYVSYYISQVQNGGHGQFAGNSKMALEVLNDVEAGLTTLGLNHLFAIFRQFRAELDSNDGLTRMVVEGCGFGEIPAEARKADDAFFQSPDPDRFEQQAMQWLKEAPCALAVSPRELSERQRAIVRSNSLLASRRSALKRRSPWTRMTNIASRMWEKTGLRRPGENALNHAYRQIRNNPSVAWQVSDAEGALIDRVNPAVLAGDHGEIDRVFAAFRDLHNRYQLAASDHWPKHIRMYASKLHYAGEQLGRCDLLEQAADAFGQTIATGQVYEWDAGFDWRSLGQSLVELGRLDKGKADGVAEAVDAFTNAVEISPAQYEILSNRLRSLLGLAEAHLFLAAETADPGHLEAARDALDLARPLLVADERRLRWGALDAELLSLRLPGKLRAKERERAYQQLSRAINWETENDGDPRANPQRLKRYHELQSLFASDPIN